MRLKRLFLKNIRSYEEQEIYFPEGSLLLSGEVGSGKTTILLAIEYALFGIQPGQKGSALLRNGVDSGEVVLEFILGEKNITIERKMKRTSKAVNNDYASITIDGRKMESSITEVKTKILSLIGYPQEFIKKNNILYRYTVYTPQEQMKQIILDDSESRLNALRHVFGIDKYKKIRENLVFLLNRIKEDLKIMQSEVKNAEADKENLDSAEKFSVYLRQKITEKEQVFQELTSFRKNIEKEVVEIEQKLNEKQRLESEMEKTKIFIASKKENLASIIKEQAELAESIAESSDNFDESKLESTLKETALKKDLIESLSSRYFSLATKITSLENLKEEILHKKERVFKIDICPTCLQDVPDFHKHNIINETERQLTEIKKSLELFSEEKKEIFKQIESEKKNLSDLEELKVHLVFLKSRLEYVSKYKNKIDEMNKTKDKIESDISLLFKHLDGLKEQVLSLSRFDNLFRSKKEELRSAFSNEKEAEISIAELKKEMELNDKEITRLKSNLSLVEKKKARLNEISDISNWLSGDFTNLIDFIERNVLIKLRKDFSRLFSKWFSLLAGDSFEVELDENFTPLIRQGEAEMEYSFLSGGERTSVALAYRLALNQTINSVLSTIKTRDIIILDEPTEGFSEQQIDKMREIFEELNIPQLIIVSHESKIEGFVDNVIKVKKGDSSTVSETIYSSHGYSEENSPKNLNTLQVNDIDTEVL